MARTVVFEPPLDDSDSGRQLSALFGRLGPNARVLLKQGARYDLRTAVCLCEDDQELATEGYPDEESSKAILTTVGDGADAIYAGFKHRQKIRNLVIDGAEPLYGCSAKREPLIFLGGNGAEDSSVEHCVLRHPRGWTCLHAFDRGVRTKVLNNVIGPSGHPAPKGPWADGVSIASEDSLISGNTIIDATDGAIVLFGAPPTPS
jgi:hypothetical protein